MQWCPLLTGVGTTLWQMYHHFKHSDHKGDRGKTLVANNSHNLTDVSFDSNFYYLKQSIYNTCISNIIKL